MNTIQLRPPPPSQDIERDYASSPCFMHQVETCFGYWDRDEELTFLNELLRLEREGTKAFAEIGKATADLHVADLVLEMEVRQASSCVLLRKEIEARDGRAGLPSSGRSMFRDGHANRDLMQVTSVASSIQQELIEVIQKAILKLADPQLRVALADMQKLHHKNIERLKHLLT